MRVALINNGTLAPERLRMLLSGNEVIEFPLEDAGAVRGENYDLIVLSGSSRFPIAYNLEILSEELSLIQTATIPLLGICFGAELLAVAHGGTLKDSGHKTKGVTTIRALSDDPLFGGQQSFEVFEAHRWAIDTVPDSLEILAYSDMGPEIIRHRSKPHYGFQFHPEKMCDETYGDELFRSFLTQVDRPSSKGGPS